MGEAASGRSFLEVFLSDLNNPPEEGMPYRTRTHDPGRETEFHGEPSGGKDAQMGSDPERGAQSQRHTGRHPVE